jgi:hypothetical protein
VWGERGRVIRDERSAFWIPTSESSRGWDDGDVGWVDDGSTASGLSPPPVPSIRAPPRAGAQRSGLTAPCAPPHAEAVRTGRHGQTLKTVSPELLPINVLQSPPYFRADEDTASGALEATLLGFTAGRWLAFRASRPAGVRSRASPARGETTAAQRRPRNAAESRGNVVKVSDLVMSNNERVDRAHVRANRAFEGELVFEGEWVPPTPFNGIAFLASGVVLRHLHRRTQARGAPRPSSIAHPKTKMKRGQAVRAPTRRAPSHPTATDQIHPSTTSTTRRKRNAEREQARPRRYGTAPLVATEETRKPRAGRRTRKRKREQPPETPLDRRGERGGR